MCHFEQKLKGQQTVLDPQSHLSMARHQLGESSGESHVKDSPLDLATRDLDIQRAQNASQLQSTRTPMCLTVNSIRGNDINPQVEADIDGVDFPP